MSAEPHALFRRTTLIIVGLLAILGGLGLARFVGPVSLVWIVLSMLSIAIFSGKRTVSRLIMIIFLALSLGLWRGGQFMTRMEPYKAIQRRAVTVLVTAQSDAVYDDSKQLSFEASGIRILKPFMRELPGRLKIQGFGEQAVYRGDRVYAVGKFYPTRGSRVGTISYAGLRVASRSTSPIEAFRKRFIAGMETALPEPQASFALGLLIGQRTTLSPGVAEALAAVGLTHIIAVSGYNLTIIVRGVRHFGKRLSKYQVAITSLLLITSFVLVTGFSASIVRAALVSGLSLWAWYYGRTFRPLLLLALVAAMTALWNPLYLWSDIGWYLSFLAFYGVLIVVPLVVSRLYRRRKPGALTVLVFETLAAQAMTAPLILYIFGEFSTVALLSNILVVPLVPFGMLLSLLAGLAGMAVPLLAGWLALPAAVLLKYMLDVAALLAAVPHASARGTLPLMSMALVYLVIVGLNWTLWRRTGVKRAIIAETEDQV